MMKQTILLALTICLFGAANAQKIKVVPAQTETKTFLVTEATAKDLPEGVEFVNNKIVLKKGYRFEQMQDGKVGLVSARRTNISASFECWCNGGNATCVITITGSNLHCGGGACCTISTIVSPTKVNLKMN